MLSVIIPAYNEGPHIYENLLRIDNEVKNFCQSYEMIVVDDGSSDQTLSEARRAALEKSNIKVISYIGNRGKGYAVKKGFEAASREWVTFLDADLDIPPQRIKIMLDKVQETGADLVIQSKRHPESIVNGFPLKRKILSRSYNLLIKMLFNLPVSDTQVGVKLYRKNLINEIMPMLKAERFAADVEQLALAHRFGYKIKECPVHIDFNPSGDRMRPKDILNIACETFGIFCRINFLNYYTPNYAARDLDQAAQENDW